MKAGETMKNDVLAQGYLNPIMSWINEGGANWSDEEAMPSFVWEEGDLIENESQSLREENGHG